MDPAIFWSSRAQKSPFWPPSVKLAPKFFPPINFWFFNENQLITLVFHPSFQESLPFGHLGVKRATWFWAFFNLSKILCFNIWFLFYSTGVIVLGLDLFHWPKFSGSGYFLILHRPEYCQKNSFLHWNTVQWCFNYLKTIKFYGNHIVHNLFIMKKIVPIFLGHKSFYLLSCCFGQN